MSPALQSMLDAPISQEDARAFAKRAHALARFSQQLLLLCELANAETAAKARVLMAKFKEKEAA